MTLTFSNIPLLFTFHLEFLAQDVHSLVHPENMAEMMLTRGPMMKNHTGSCEDACDLYKKTKS